MPFIRHGQGDLAVLYESYCSSGQTFRAIQLVLEPINIQVELVPRIKRLGRGKHHPIVSHVTQRIRR